MSQIFFLDFFRTFIGLSEDNQSGELIALALPYYMNEAEHKAKAISAKLMELYLKNNLGEMGKTG